MLNSKGKIVTTQEILEQVAKERDVPVQTVKYVYEFFVNHYLKHLITQTDATAILFRHLGTLVMSSDTVDVKVGKLQADANKGRISKDDPQYQAYLKKQADIKENVQYVRDNFLLRSHHVLKPLHKTDMVRCGYSMEDVEFFQNNDIFDLSEYRDRRVFRNYGKEFKSKNTFKRKMAREEKYRQRGWMIEQSKKAYNEKKKK